MKHVSILRWAALAILISAPTAMVTACAESRPPVRMPSPSVSAESIPTIVDSLQCESVQVLEGDPDSFAEAAGFDCVLGRSSSLVFRVYEKSDASSKAMADWSDLINSNNQIITGVNWFALGPAPVLEATFGSMATRGPADQAPPTEIMTISESNRALCSSIAYEVITATVLDDGSTDPDPYLSSYPGLDQVRSEIAGHLSADELIGDDYSAMIAITEFDGAIKALCDRLEKR